MERMRRMRSEDFGSVGLGESKEDNFIDFKDILSTWVDLLDMDFETFKEDSFIKKDNLEFWSILEEYLEGMMGIKSMK